MGNQWGIHGKSMKNEWKDMGNSGDSEPSLDFELWPTTWSEIFWLETGNQEILRI
jgi:hypothetical protein